MVWHPKSPNPLDVILYEVWGVKGGEEERKRKREQKDTKQSTSSQGSERRNQQGPAVR